MGNYFSGIPSTSRPQNTPPTNQSNSDSNAQMFSMAQRFGIDYSKYCTYDENGNVKSVDQAALNAAIEAEKAREAAQASTQPQNDQFCKSGEDQKLTDKELVEADECRTEIDAEYDAALAAYAASLEAGTVDANTEDNMEAIKDEANDYLGVNVTNTTVLEGGQDFINRMQTVTTDTKKNQGEETGEVAEDPTGDAAIDATPITTTSAEEDSSNPFSNPYYTSAYDTTDMEEEDAVAA